MRCIFVIFFIFMLTLARGGDVKSDSGFKISRDNSAGYRGVIEAEIKQIDSELTRLLLAPKISKDRAEILISSKVPKANLEVRRSGDRVIIYLGSEFALLDSALSRRKLAGTMLSVRYGIVPKRELPAWISAALEESRRRAKVSYAIVSNRNSYPMLGAMLSAGIAPNWRAIIEVDWQSDGRIDDRLFGEYSLATVNVLRNLSTLSANGLENYIIGFLEAKMPSDELLETTIVAILKDKRPDLTLDAQMELEYNKIAFNSNNLRGAEFALQDFPRQLMGEGYSLGNLSQLLQDSDPLGVIGRRQIIENLRFFSRGLNADAAKECVELIVAIEKLSGKAPSTEKKRLSSQVEKVAEALEKQSKIELFMSSVERDYVPPLVLISSELEILRNSDKLMTTRGEKFFLETEKKYLEQ